MGSLGQLACKSMAVPISSGISKCALLTATQPFSTDPSQALVFCGSLGDGDPGPSSSSRLPLPLIDVLGQVLAVCPSPSPAAVFPISEPHSWKSVRTSRVQCFINCRVSFSNTNVNNLFRGKQPLSLEKAACHCHVKNPAKS